MITQSTNTASRHSFVAGTISSHPLTLAYDNWENELTDDSDKLFVLNGIVHGFCIISSPHQFQNVHCSNYKSATDPTIFNCVVQSSNWIKRLIKEIMYFVKTSHPLLVAWVPLKRPMEKSNWFMIVANQNSMGLIHMPTQQNSSMKQLTEQCRYFQWTDIYGKVRPK